MTKYLGLDSSTQSITAIVIEENSAGSSRIILEKSLNFDIQWPEFGTKNGVIPGKPEGVAHTPPQLWVKALDGIFQALKDEGTDLASIRAIGVSGQQHGSVYLNAKADKVLENLDPSKSLHEQMEGIFSRFSSPIWMDASTSNECAEIASSLGGDDEVCKLTGSRAFERFTGPQIRKFFKSEPKSYEATAHICLVSSFIPSILAGKVVGIDPGDGAGMNLMDIQNKTWSQVALKATAPGLSEKLKPIVPSDSVVGNISSYFVSKYGFSSNCQILPGTGDNPSSLIGLGLVSVGKVGISLGTSDTLFAFMSRATVDPSGQSHVFGSPTGDYMSLSCYKNGSLARETIREQFHLDWPSFSAILDKNSAGNHGRVMLAYFDTEIIPRVLKPGVQRFGFSAGDKEENVTAVIEGQMASMSNHSAWMPEAPKHIFVTGGASKNQSILQIMADVFGCPVHQQETAAAAALGSAIRAQHAALKSAGKNPSWDLLTEPYASTAAQRTITPRPERHHDYEKYKEIYASCEDHYLNQGGHDTVGFEKL